jgi:hypothetical protein
MYCCVPSPPLPPSLVLREWRVRDRPLWRGPGQALRVRLPGGTAGRVRRRDLQHSGLISWSDAPPAERSSGARCLVPDSARLWEGSSFWSVKLGSLWPRQVACRPLRTHDPWSAGRSRRMTRRGGVRFETYGAGVQRRDGSPVCAVCRPEVCLAWAASRQRDDLESRPG